MSGLPASPADWTVRALDLGGAADKAGLMDRIAAALALPSWFGRNWDALADVLGDHQLMPDGAAVLVVSGWRDFEARNPAQWATAVEVFDQAAAITVLLSLGGSDDHPRQAP
ncbi:MULTISPECIES: barstar family protein [Streptomyces]|uniref:Barstar family protein n=1 Tax=Streptomyces xanthii TaxID=2768069 RepID=A0A7H1BF72_9ACTN|nr:barstar family protein [Streptomyces xanthii]QNS07377.1 barstar family protein [Streptomyces xanthii]